MKNKIARYGLFYFMAYFFMQISQSECGRAINVSFLLRNPIFKEKK